jgi:hypothetical protein
MSLITEGESLRSGGLSVYLLQVKEFPKHVQVRSKPSTQHSDSHPRSGLRYSSPVFHENRRGELVHRRGQIIRSPHLETSIIRGDVIDNR